MGNDDCVQSVVIDPSIAKGKITPQQWQNRQGQPGSMLFTMNAGPYDRNKYGSHVENFPSDREVVKHLRQAPRQSCGEPLRAGGTPPP